MRNQNVNLSQKQLMQQNKIFSHHNLCKSSYDLRRSSRADHDRPTGSCILFSLDSESRKSSSDGINKGVVWEPMHRFSIVRLRGIREVKSDLVLPENMVCVMCCCSSCLLLYYKSLVKLKLPPSVCMKFDSKWKVYCDQ
mmetsp:Transcript_27256/g.41223  ORF Transcript_27256/g.41223 Transcript_27256/m.41223 type:complete len:139 (+) Transcript_27256:435-851(+)